MPEDIYSPARRPPLKNLSQGQADAADELLEDASVDDEAPSKATPCEKMVGLVDEGFLKGRFRRAQSHVMAHVNGRTRSGGGPKKASVSYADMGRVMNCTREHARGGAAGESLLAVHKWTFFLEHFAEQIALCVGPAAVQKRRAGFREAMQAVNVELAKRKEPSLGKCVADLYLGASTKLRSTERHAVADVYLEVLSGSFMDRLRRGGKEMVLFPKMGDDEAEALLRLIHAEWDGEPDVLRDAGLPHVKPESSVKKRRAAMEMQPSHLAWLREHEHRLVHAFGPAFLVTCKVLSVSWRDLEELTQRDLT